ncbi:hypothetical protein KBD49_00305 [Myxococcota bacterium]|nr:hypothetical protein [Myxococcota bacterium]
MSRWWMVVLEGWICACGGSPDPGTDPGAGDLRDREEVAGDSGPGIGDPGNDPGDVLPADAGDSSGGDVGEDALEDVPGDPAPDFQDVVPWDVPEDPFAVEVPATPGGLPLALPFRLVRDPGEGAPSPEETAEVTRRVTGFWKRIDYFTWAAETSAGMDASTGVPDYLIWWHDFVAEKAGDTVTFRANAADGGSHNNAEPTGIVLASALAGYRATGDPAMGYLADQYTRSLTACMRGFVRDADDPVDWLLARNLIGRNHSFLLPSGKKKVVEYDQWYFPYEGWNADRFRYPGNPTYGDVWVTNKRSKDDLPYLWRSAAWLLYLVEDSPDPALQASAREALDLLRKSARDIVESGWKIRTKDADGNVLVPPGQDLASFVDYVDLIPDAECDARLATALMADGDPHGQDCGSGQGSLYDDFAAAGHYFNYDIIVHFHLAAIHWALVTGHPRIARDLLLGLATRLERYQDPRSGEPGLGDPSFPRDIAMWLLRGAALGLPLTAAEARLIQRFHRQSVDYYDTFPRWDLWSSEVPDGVYSFRDGFHPRSIPEALRIEDFTTLLEYCASPFRNPAGVPVADCDQVLDPTSWGR